MSSVPFLTYYAFSELVDGIQPAPLGDGGADAAAVHEFLCRVEQHALTGALSGLDDDSRIESAQKAGLMLQAWIESVTRFGAASFLEQDKYFVPMPVALMSIVN